MIDIDTEFLWSDWTISILCYHKSRTGASFSNQLDRQYSISMPTQTQCQCPFAKSKLISHTAYKNVFDFNTTRAHMHIYICYLLLDILLALVCYVYKKNLYYSGFYAEYGIPCHLSFYIEFKIFFSFLQIVLVLSVSTFVSANKYAQITQQENVSVSAVIRTIP